ncbi:hypothetical protein Tco_0529840 [Tanacetum coccineum]
MTVVFHVSSATKWTKIAKMDQGNASVTCFGDVAIRICSQEQVSDHEIQEKLTRESGNPGEDGKLWTSSCQNRLDGPRISLLELVVVYENEIRVPDWKCQVIISYRVREEDIPKIALQKTIRTLEFQFIHFRVDQCTCLKIECCEELRHLSNHSSRRFASSLVGAVVNSLQELECFELGVKNKEEAFSSIEAKILCAVAPIDLRLCGNGSE